MGSTVITQPCASTLPVQASPCSWGTVLLQSAGMVIEVESMRGEQELKCDHLEREGSSFSWGVL